MYSEAGSTAVDESDSIQPREHLRTLVTDCKSRKLLAVIVESRD